MLNYKYSNKSDIWSLGACLFGAASKMQYKQTKNIFTFIKDNNIKFLLEKMLQTNPKHRPDIEYVLDYINKFCED